MVIRVVEVVYRYEENLGVKGPNNNKNKNKDVGLPMTMPQAAGKNPGIFRNRDVWFLYAR